MKKKTTRKRNTNGLNQYTKNAIVEYTDPKGHPLRTIWFRQRKIKGKLIRVTNFLFCPKCELFFELKAKPIKIMLGKHL